MVSNLQLGLLARKCDGSFLISKIRGIEAKQALLSEINKYLLINNNVHRKIQKFQLRGFLKLSNVKVFKILK